MTAATGAALALADAAARAHADHCDLGCEPPAVDHGNPACRVGDRLSLVWARAWREHVVSQSDRGRG